MKLFEIFKGANKPCETITYGEFVLTQKFNAQSVIEQITNGAIKINSGLYNDGLFSVLDESISGDISNSWNWQFQGTMMPIVATAFGDLFLFDTKNRQISFFQTQYNTVEPIADSVAELLDKALPFPSIRQGVLKEPNLQKVKAVCGELQYGKTYILKPWEMLGGVDKIENYTVGGLCVYHNLVSQTLRGNQ